MKKQTCNVRGYVKSAYCFLTVLQSCYAVLKYKQY